MPTGLHIMQNTLRRVFCVECFLACERERGVFSAWGEYFLARVKNTRCFSRNAKSSPEWKNDEEKEQ